MNRAWLDGWALDEQLRYQFIGGCLQSNEMHIYWTVDMLFIHSIITILVYNISVECET